MIYPFLFLVSKQLLKELMHPHRDCSPFPLRDWQHHDQMLSRHISLPDRIRILDRELTNDFLNDDC